ncbi:MAG: FMN-binding negative transcriptional regulator [Pseudomonadota bacterium]
MYVPAAFAAPDLAVVHELIAAHGFATLISVGPGGPVASHVPILLEPARGPHGTLLGHLARANPHWRDLDGAEALVIFMGPHGYVSPAWYRTQPAVPTWNYAAVHAYGRARLVDDDSGLEAILARLVDRYEGGRAPPWSMTSLAPDYLSAMLKGIVGFEVEIARLEGKLKLSQNRSAEDRRRVIAALAASPSGEDRVLAAFMTAQAGP